MRKDDYLKKIIKDDDQIQMKPVLRSKCLRGQNGEVLLPSKAWEFWIFSSP